MNLNQLNRIQLDQRLQTLVGRERELLHEILLTIKEVHARRTYLEFGFPNLFAYLTGRMGLSAGSAQRRIEAMRLLKEIPSVGEKIASGKLNLQQITLVQKTAREAGKHSKVVTAEDKKAVIEKIGHKNFQESQKAVAAFFEMPLTQGTSQKTQADESVRVEMTISKELYEKIQQAQALLSHAVGSADLVDYLAYVTDRVIRQKTSLRKSSSKFTSTVEPSLKNNSKVEPAEFSERTKKLVRQTADGCQYQDPASGKKCGSQWFLQVDHKQSRWAGGRGHITNAQLLCAAHNQLKYKKECRQQIMS